MPTAQQPQKTSQMQSAQTRGSITGTFAKVAFKTMGCKTNRYESDAMASQFADAGFAVVSEHDLADVYVVNTCTVTAEAGRKSRQAIRRFRRQNSTAVVVAMGCESELRDLSDMADIAIGTRGRNVVLQRVLALLDDRDKHAVPERANNLAKSIAADADTKMWRYEEPKVAVKPTETRAQLKICDGCNQHCTYCAIRVARGPVRSRSLKEIIREAKSFVLQGYKEIVVTGIHICSYGSDFATGKPDFADVLIALNSIKGLVRIRLGSLEPGLVTKEFVQRISGLEKLCPHFHLSLQSGCDETLARMNRRYTTSEYREAVDKIRKYYPQAAITTDVIVGFPAETEAEFTQTYHFVEEINFALLHVFPFSRREGTKAYDMPEQIDNQSKKRRSEQLIRLAQEMTASYLEQFIGQELMVLIESVNESGAYGLTKEHVAVQIDTQNVKSGNIVPCLATSSDGSKLLAKPL